MRSGTLGFHHNSTRIKITPEHASIEFSKKKLKFKYFVIINIIVAFTASFTFPFAFLSLLYLNTPTLISWSADVLSLLVISPWLCSILSPIAIPMSIPEVDFKTVTKDYFQRYENVLLFLRSDKCFRFCIFRHFVLGSYAAIIFIPISIFIASINVIMSSAVLLTYLCLYIASISAFITPFSILSFTIQPNYDRVMYYINISDKHTFTILLKKLVKCPLC